MRIWDLNNIRQLMYKLSEIELLIKKENLNGVNILYDFILTQARTNN